MITSVSWTLGPASIWNPPRTGRRRVDAIGRAYVAWIFRILSVAAATITSLFVAGDALNFSIVQTFVTITLIVGFGIAAVGWSMRRDI